MAIKNIILPAIAMAGYAAAQSSCTASATMTISSQADASQIAGCSTFSGNIAIATGMTTALSLDGVQKIVGDLIVENVIGLPSLEAGSLESIEGTFSLTNMTLLTSLNMPQLSSVDIIEWITLPRLNALTFNTGVSTAQTVNIYDSQLGSLEGLNLETVSELTISNNGQLTSVDLPIKSIDTGLAIEFNGQTMDVSFPNLENAFNMTFRNVSSLSMPSLSTVNASVGFYGCTFDTVSLMNLTAVGGSLTFTSNDDLTNITMPQLTTITDALVLTSNGDLDMVNGFGALKDVSGTIDLSGNFSSVSLPSLKQVGGVFNLQSSNTNISNSCGPFQSLKNSGGIQGPYTCKSTSTPTSQTSGGSGTSGSGSGGTSTHTGAASGFYARSVATTGVLGVIAAMLGMF